MPRRLPYTPNSIIRSALRQCWLRSRERSAALKATGNCCIDCGKKASKAKGREVALDVHHMRAINWERIFEVIRAELLVDPKWLVPMCEECHKEKHKIESMTK